MEMESMPSILTTRQPISHLFAFSSQHTHVHSKVHNLDRDAPLVSCLLSPSPHPPLALRTSCLLALFLRVWHSSLPTLLDLCSCTSDPSASPEKT